MYTYSFDFQQHANKEVQRIINEQVDYAVSLFKKKEITIEKAIHETRKSIKRIRALLLFIKDLTKNYNVKKEQTYIRDTARLLSELRTSDVFIETFDKINDDINLLTKDESQQVKKTLNDHKQLIFQAKVNNGDVINEVVNRLEKFKSTSQNIKLKKKGLCKIIPHIAFNYKEGKKLLKVTKQNPDSELLHDFRKQVKYLYFQLLLLEGIWPEMIKVYTGWLKSISEILGKEHDLAELSYFLAEHQGIDNNLKLQVESIIAEHRLNLKLTYIPLAEKIYVETPKNFTRRLKEYCISSK